VRGAAVWALGQLDPERLRALAHAYRARETDANVQDEWRAA